MFTYKPIALAEEGSFFEAAFVGTYSTVIGWNIKDPTLRKGLHGFAVKRTEWDNDTSEVLDVSWLGGYKRFEAFDTAQLGDVGSLTAPFQRFRWIDYTLRSGRSYRYEVYPMRGEPGALKREDKPIIYKSRYYIDLTEDSNWAIRKENKVRQQECKPVLKEKTIPIHLKDDGSWSDTAFDSKSNTHKFADRNAFSGL